MGFGLLFLGVMFLFDAQIALMVTGTEQIRGILDLFPDALGWILIALGLSGLTKREESFVYLKRFSFLMLALSLVSLAKDVLFFSVFYRADGSEQIFAGELLDDFEHVITLVFLYLLYSKTSVLCRKRGEDKLSRFHAMIPKLCVAEGACAVSVALARTFLVGVAPSLVSILSRLDYLFWIFLIWAGVIAFVRALIRIDN